MSQISLLESRVNQFRDQANSIALRMVAIESRQKDNTAITPSPKLDPFADFTTNELLEELRQRVR